MSRYETLTADYDPYREFYEQGADGEPYRPLRQLANPRGLTHEEQASLSRAGLPSCRVEALDYQGYSGKRCTIFRMRK